jgi:hypothetical protein
MAITAMSRKRRCAKGVLTKASRAGDANWLMEFTITVSNLERRL